MIMKNKTHRKINPKGKAVTVSLDWNQKHIRPNPEA